MRHAAPIVSLLALAICASACSETGQAEVATNALAVAVPTRQEVEQAIFPLQAQWPIATGTHECVIFERILADDYLSTTPDGTRNDKPAQVAGCKANTNTYTRSENVDVTMTAFGSDFAVTMGDNIAAGTAKDGRRFEGTSRWTNVWAKRDGAWQIVASHNSVVPK
jgi:ketosteroid isomerase-like protein